jgi:hypothetical protein
MDLLDHQLESRLDCTLGPIVKPLTATAKPSQELIPGRSTAGGQQKSTPGVLMREGVTVCECKLRFSQTAYAMNDDRSAEEGSAKVRELLASANKKNVVIGKVGRAGLREAHPAGNLVDLLGELAYQSVDPSVIAISELLDRTLSKVVALAAIDFGYQLRTFGVWVRIIED